jgi:hypothetical protein
MNMHQSCIFVNTHFYPYPLSTKWEKNFGPSRIADVAAGMNDGFDVQTRVGPGNITFRIRVAKGTTHVECLPSDCGPGQFVVKGEERELKEGDCHEELSQGIMVQHPDKKGLRQYHPSGGGVSEGKRGARRAGAREYNANEVYQIPFRLDGRIILSQSYNQSLATI